MCFMDDFGRVQRIEIEFSNMKQNVCCKTLLAISLLVFLRKHLVQEALLSISKLILQNVWFLEMPCTKFATDKASENDTSDRRQHHSVTEWSNMTAL